MDLAWKNVAGRYLDLDPRIWFFTNYYSISPGMLSKIPGKGAAYMIGFTDHPQALRPNRICDQQELEAWGHREGEVTRDDQT